MEKEKLLIRLRALLARSEENLSSAWRRNAAAVLPGKLAPESRYYAGQVEMLQSLITGLEKNAEIVLPSW